MQPSDEQRVRVNAIALRQWHSDFSLDDLRDALWLAWAEAMRAREGWIACSERMPASGVTVLAAYVNSNGKPRRIRAQWIAAKTRESDPEYNDLPLVYDEATDCYYYPEGWYEQMDNWGEYTSVFVSENVPTHWMPMPAAPQPGGEGER